MDEVLEQLKNIPGAAEHATKLAEQWKATSTELDTLRAEHGAAKKRLGSAEKDLAKYKSDLDGASKGADERFGALTKERDDAKAEAERLKGDFDGYKLRSAVAEKLGIPDATRRKRAVDAFVREYMPEGAGLDEKGELAGVEKALKTFREREGYFFAEADAGFGGKRAGGDPVPGAERKSDKKGADDDVDAWSKKLYPKRYEQQKGASK